MQLSNEEALNLVRQGAEALQQGRAAEARERFERVTQTGRANAQIWLLLAAACRGQNDSAGEEAAVDGLLAIEPHLLRAHIMKADCRARAGDDRTALRFYESARAYARTEKVADDLVPEMRRIDDLVARLQDRLEAQREATLTAQGMPPETRSPRFQQSLDILAGRKRIYVQEPTGYYFPGLPQIQFFERSMFGWVDAVESATGAIRQELKALVAGGIEGFRPYLQADPNQPRLDDNPLLDSRDWSALFLCENGRVDAEAVARCPRTWEAVQAAPLPHIHNSPTVMFSMLRSGARIPAHTGMLNTRLTCHLPLIVPPGCRYRVGNEFREWEEGRLLIFDDTIEHEAWNDGSEDRVVLIFDIWRPELSAQEQREVAALLASSGLE